MIAYQRSKQNEFGKKFYLIGDKKCNFCEQIAANHKLNKITLHFVSISIYSFSNTYHAVAIH